MFLTLYYQNRKICDAVFVYLILTVNRHSKELNKNDGQALLCFQNTPKAIIFTVRTTFMNAVYSVLKKEVFFFQYFFD